MSLGSLPRFGVPFLAAISLSAWCADDAAAQFDNQWVTFQNQSATRLSLPSNQISNGTTEVDFATGDLDNDGAVDLVIARKEPFTTGGKRPNMLLMNENGVLTDRSALYASASDVAGDQGFLTPTNDRDIAVTDVDQDGWLDVATAVVISFSDPKHISHPRVYRNLQETAGSWNGLRFENGRIPQLMVGPTPTGGNSCSVVAGDVTDDIYPELFLVDYDNFDPIGQDLGHRLLINDGFGFFADESLARLTALMMESGFGVRGYIADANGDGHNELLKAEAGIVDVIYNNPANPGHFNIIQNAYLGSAYHMAAGDLNNDFKLDIAVTDDFTDSIRYNQGNDALGRVIWGPGVVFTMAGGGSEGSIGGNSRIADIDHDGWNDVIIADVDVDISGCFGRAMIYRNPGGTAGSNITLVEERQNSNFTGWVGAVGITSGDLGGTYESAVFDVDNNGSNDIVIGRCTGTFVFTNTMVCQEDVGFQGKGPGRLSVCGGDLSTGSTANMVVAPIKAGRSMLMLGAFTSLPTQVWELQSKLVPIPPLFAVGVVAPSSALEIPIAGGNGPGSLFIQWVIEDPDVGTPSGWYATNAVRLDFLP